MIHEGIHPPGPIAELPATRPIAVGLGSVIGLSKLREQIGEGGMGVVYLAEQETLVRQRVALNWTVRLILSPFSTDNVEPGTVECEWEVVDHEGC